MAIRKCRNIFFPEYFMAVRKFTSFCHIPKYFCSSVNINGRFTQTLFLVCFIFHLPLLHKKGYGLTELGIVTLTLTAAVATSVTSLYESLRESPGRYRLSTYANNDVFREMLSTAPTKYYCFLSTTFDTR